ncbi:hypothetical protein RB25_09660 [Herbaspirillum rubrisubalbicans]|uniref:hypothetical protein n=1 Tax=Herbaspirillum rubrisubalbicans TaxID=80842 RepID=UPI000DC55AFD|nr:hypothetical protein [Herbaspirillum rubrisubalbicans]RAN48601.1 hypothetical protein RB25_09660 [Herbaspirillum rubrisubalbicans]
MPITAYSISEKKELDVEQVLQQLARRAGIPTLHATAPIPESWRAVLREDLECPCCFVKGAEVVKQAISRGSGKIIRQACFRFVTPGHHPNCDYAEADSTDFIPENLVHFGAAKTKLTRAVRDLVCVGISIGAFSQAAIRDMREWFFHLKQASNFVVTLDESTPRRIDMLIRLRSQMHFSLPDDLDFDEEIACLPGFNISGEAARLVMKKYREAVSFTEKHRLWYGSEYSRITALAKRYYGKTVFDPVILQGEYEKTVELARFATWNYEPFMSASKKNPHSLEHSVLALCAVLLYVSNWEIVPATRLFAKIATKVGAATPDLGNVIGLNPFHDFMAWRNLKKMQELQNAQLLSGDPGKEWLDQKTELSAFVLRFHVENQE